MKSFWRPWLRNYWTQQSETHAKYMATICCRSIMCWKIMVMAKGNPHDIVLALFFSLFLNGIKIKRFGSFSMIIGCIWSREMNMQQIINAKSNARIGKCWIVKFAAFDSGNLILFSFPLTQYYLINWCISMAQKVFISCN